MAMGLEAKVTVLDRSVQRLNELDMRFGGQLDTLYSTVDAIEQHVAEADLVVGAVLVPGAAAPKLVPEDMVKRMRPGPVLVDIALDQGRRLATLRPTTPADPVYRLQDVVHYCAPHTPR